MFRSDNSSHGWNAIVGQTYGAYCEKMCPGGSSGGCAVAVDTGLCWGAVGTEVRGVWRKVLKTDPFNTDFTFPSLVFFRLKHSSSCYQ